MGNLNFNKYSDVTQKFISELEEIDSIIDQNQSILVKSNWEITLQQGGIIRSPFYLFPYSTRLYNGRAIFPFQPSSNQ